MIDAVLAPWPWWVAGPLIGLVVPFVFWYGGRKWGVSSSLRHLCAATLPAGLEYFRYDWKRRGGWHLAMAAGMVVGGGLAVTVLSGPGALHVDIAGDTAVALRGLGISDLGGLLPDDLFSVEGLASLPGTLIILGGGFLVGFGARYAGGCTSGHAISGMANLQLSSLVATLGFFAGGLVSAHLLLPLVLPGGGP